MQEYKGITRANHPHSPIWGYIALYDSITDDFENDEPLQKLVRRHYLKQSMLRLIFNVSIYAFIYSIIWLIK